uniref:Ig-like domain-containing protein n=1 Tax=Sphenodon punctatus TaxID=8508 RepID=A0A8D0HEJ8_SPHPU
MSAHRSLPKAAVASAFLILLLPMAAAETFQVLTHDVTASVGSDARLSCRLSPALNAEGMQVRWTHGPSSRNVYLYRDDGSELPGRDYENRTELILDNIRSGRVALRIRNIQPKDNGLYVCDFQSKTYYNQAMPELSVTSLGSTPQIHITGLEAGRIQVGCNSTGWYPAPEMLWRNSLGKIETSFASEARCGLQSFCSVSSSSFILLESNNTALSCIVRASTSSHERESSVLISGEGIKDGE